MNAPRENEVTVFRAECRTCQIHNGLFLTHEEAKLANARHFVLATETPQWHAPRTELTITRVKFVILEIGEE